MTTVLRADLLSLLCLLIIAPATAYAECAWVLWVQTDDGTTQSDQAESAYAAREACVVALRQNAAVLKEAGVRVIAEYVERAVVVGTKGKSRVRYVCLPDTVDPRGAKGVK